MTAQQLKNSILQMAVQGKLVPQDPNDEPASVLLERIRAEKERLIKEKKIKREKNPSVIFKGADNTPYEKIGDEVRSLADEVPFDIPDSWEWVRLGTLLGIISDGTHKTPNYVEDGVPFLSVQNISKGYFDFTKVKYITEDEHRKLCERVAPQAGDILFCRIGTLGKAIKCTLNIEFSIFVSLGLLRPIDPSVTDYLVFTINSPLGEKWIQENKVGGGTHTYKINLSDIPNMLIPLPPYQEQNRIFAKLQELKPILHEYGKTEERLDSLSEGFPEALKKSILQEAVQGKLVPQDPSDEPAEALLERIRAEKQRLIKEGKIKKDKHESVIFRRDNSHYEKLDGVERCIDDELPFEIPENWSWQRIPTISLSISAGGDKPSVFSKVKTEECSVPVYSNGEKDDGLFGYTDVAKVFDKSVTISGRGTVGFSCVRNEPYVPIVRLITVVPCAGIDLQYLHFVFTALFEQGVGTSIQQLTVPMLQVKLIPVPPIAEQHRIVQRIEELLPLVKGL
jgi:type I restriction enzyme S subunit